MTYGEWLHIKEQIIQTVPPGEARTKLLVKHDKMRPLQLGSGEIAKQAALQYRLRKAGVLNEKLPVDFLGAEILDQDKVSEAINQQHEMIANAFEQKKKEFEKYYFQKAHEQMEKEIAKIAQQTADATSGFLESAQLAQSIVVDPYMPPGTVALITPSTAAVSVDIQQKLNAYLEAKQQITEFLPPDVAEHCIKKLNAEYQGILGEGYKDLIFKNSMLPFADKDKPKSKAKTAPAAEVLELDQKRKIEV